MNFKIILFSILVVCTPIHFLHAEGAGLDALVAFTFADEFDIDGVADVQSDSAFALGVRYKENINNFFGFDTGLGIESIREFDDGSGRKLGFVLLEGNARFNLDPSQSIYIFAGLNYPLLIYEDQNISDVDPALGIQFGSGFSFTTSAGMELYFRTTNFEIGSRETALWGFALRGYYTFQAL